MRAAVQLQCNHTDLNNGLPCKHIGRFGVKHKNDQGDFANGFGICYRVFYDKSGLQVSPSYVMNRNDDES
ncbi:predicted protein [Botrytis cinerea T4]|uniref:Uncharacterized protein n=1 Tax=Botryotinia fuckeliana (strain T4) TaxID=999810 RepID=G2Y3M2_BOTF4|nr:predicted protein [Botrytis cinerea T4]